MLPSQADLSRHVESTSHLSNAPAILSNHMSSNEQIINNLSMNQFNNNNNHVNYNKG